MRRLMIAVAALAAGGLVAFSSARAESGHDLGGPMQVGNQCWVGTDSVGIYGYWKDCAPAAKAKRAKKK